MQNINEVAQWVEDSIAEFGDPSEPIAQLFCKWTDALEMYRGEEIVAGFLDGQPTIRLGPGAYIPIDLETGGKGWIDTEGIKVYGAVAIAPGLWSISPSLYIHGVIHAFVVLFNVPAAPPWEKLVRNRKILNFAAKPIA